MIGRMRVFLGGLLLVALNSVAGSPVHYVENKNQWPSDFRFGADFPQMKVMLKDASIFFIQHTFIPGDKKSRKKQQLGTIKESHVHSAGEMSIATFELTFLDALTPTIKVSDKQVTKYHYYYGNEPSEWSSNAAAYGQIVYDEMYKGIDLNVYSQNDAMKYDWIVSPCADVRKIRFTYKGVEHIDLKDENLVVTSKLGEVVETKPYAYQLVNGQRRTVPAAFEIDDEVVTFIFPAGYDSNYELVIDPTLIFSGYSGSTLDNWGNTATPDSKGNLYSGGMVDDRGIGSGRTFPTTPGAFQTTHRSGGNWDIGILKYDSAGSSLLYVSYLGGTGTETPQSFVVNQNDELLILGATSSTDFPGTAGGFKGGTTIDPIGGVLFSGGTDIFISKLSVDGSSLLKSTYIGGTENDGINFISGEIEDIHVESPLARNYGDQMRGDIFTDASGFVYIASNTMSDDFPVVNADGTVAYHNGTHDAVVAKFDPNLSVVWTRLIGGSQTDAAYSVKLNDSNHVIVAGGTTSNDLAGMNGNITAAPGNTDGWIAELSASGDQIINETYLGTSSYDQVYFIDLATNGDVVAFGQTQGSYLFTPGVYGQPNSGQFIHRFKSDLKTTVFATTIGTRDHNPNISPTAFLVNACDNIYIAGWGGEINNSAIFWGGTTLYLGGRTFGLPVTSDAWQPGTLGNDFYMAVITGDAKQLVYGTFLGGTASLTHVDGGTSRFDKRGIVYHSVCAGCGGRPDDFPSYNVPEARRENRSTNCNNAAFKFDLSSLRAVIQTNNIVLTKPGFNLLCIPDSIVFQNLSLGGESFEWDFGDGNKKTTILRDNIKYYYQKPGLYTVWLKAIDISTCVGIDSISTVVNVYKPDMHVGPDQAICFGSSTKLITSGNVSNVWQTIAGFNSADFEPTVSPDTTTNYYVTMTDADGCVLKDTLSVRVVPGIDVKFNYNKVYDCDSRPFLKVQSTTNLKEGEEAVFLFGDGGTSDEAETSHYYEKDGEYTVSLRATKEFCTYAMDEDVRIITVRVPNVITPLKEDGINDTFRIMYGDPAFLKDDVVVKLKVVDRWGVQVFESKNYKDDWKGSDIEAGVYYFEMEMVGELTCRGWVQLIK
jgi:hypothetical protein